MMEFNEGSTAEVIKKNAVTKKENECSFINAQKEKMNTAMRL